MFIDQLVSFTSKDKTEVIEAEDDPFDLTAGG